MTKVRKIVSGGQTGADRAALDFAAENGFEMGGYVPKGRRTEDGPLGEKYINMIETPTANYAERTALNVRDSDVTLIVSHGPLSGGSLLTRTLATRYGRPVFHVDLAAPTFDAAVSDVGRWLDESDCRILNIAGPRSSTDPAIYDAVKRLLKTVLFGD